ncbi:hypothetical protein L226DRAFT_570527 [Lentinus tigrinus ALCF2SS1-7]|uniref:uncharacterized protein n=1 Tax=Lentinus tigrinus ALCF2SS1-7 TaxID=1328758 RepID=UPI0011662DAD|nr:hypothetical protein L226DRAFT_570527 [Lentinus tigrinus ALCF2SS1-7]
MPARLRHIPVKFFDNAIGKRVKASRTPTLSSSKRSRRAAKTTPSPGHLRASPDWPPAWRHSTSPDQLSHDAAETSSPPMVALLFHIATSAPQAGENQDTITPILDACSCAPLATMYPASSGHIGTVAPFVPAPIVVASVFPGGPEFGSSWARWYPGYGYPIPKWDRHPGPVTSDAYAHAASFPVSALGSHPVDHFSRDGTEGNLNLQPPIQTHGQGTKTSSRPLGSVGVTDVAPVQREAHIERQVSVSALSTLWPPMLEGCWRTVEDAERAFACIKARGPVHSVLHFQDGHVYGHDIASSPCV